MSSASPSSTSSSGHGAHAPQKIWPMAIGAIGVVYGDIGTSPLYAFREAAHHMSGAGEFARADVFGLLSLIIWTLIIIVTLKYVVLLLRIDNRGEGGTLALMALARSITYRNTIAFLFLGMAGAALFFGDAMITPAISVLSAVEGLQVVRPEFGPYVLPITALIIIGLFSVQSRGTAKVSQFFGPITVLWFLVMGLMGLMHIAHDPDILLAINPYYSLQFLMNHGKAAFVVLGSVFLAVTGAEALYADLGHFGRRPIQLAWGWFVFPCLLLNYLGQGALVLRDPSAIDNPFFRMVSEDWQLPLVLLATCATIIAAQAVITGAFSIARQASNLGLLPRLRIKQTSDIHSGQIYLPQLNYILMIGVLILVVLFRSSTNLASLYGISVTGAMVVDAIMVAFVIWQVWGWSAFKTALVVLPFLIIECVFLAANLTKLGDGGWVPVMIALTVMAIMGTWIKGNVILKSREKKRHIKTEKFMKDYKTLYPNLQQVEGCAFHMTADPELVPMSLLQNIKHNRVLHERNVILSIKVEPYPYVDSDDRAIITHINDDFTLVVLRFGFKDDFNIQQELAQLNTDPETGIDFDWQKTSLFISRRSVRSHPRYGLPPWQDFIYIWLDKNASEPTDYYRLPVSRVIEIGRQVII